MHSSLGERMKSYENKNRLNKDAVIIRIDGHNFHKWTKFTKDSFDMNIRSSMVTAGKKLAQEMQGFRLAYAQSDEISFLLTNKDKDCGWFGLKEQKITSIVASRFTWFFNDHSKHYHSEPAFFDARIFSIPLEDMANYFVWRQQDWCRNAITLLARTVFNHKEIQGLSGKVLIEKLKEHKVYFDELNDINKYGTFMFNNEKDIYFCNSKLKYDDINKLAQINI